MSDNAKSLVFSAGIARTIEQARIDTDAARAQLAYWNGLALFYAQRIIGNVYVC